MDILKKGSINMDRYIFYLTNSGAFNFNNVHNGKIIKEKEVLRPQYFPDATVQHFLAKPKTYKTFLFLEDLLGFFSLFCPMSPLSYKVLIRRNNFWNFRFWLRRIKILSGIELKTNISKKPAKKSLVYMAGKLN